METDLFGLQGDDFVLDVSSQLRVMWTNSKRFVFKSLIPSMQTTKTSLKSDLWRYLAQESIDYLYILQN